MGLRATRVLTLLATESVLPRRSMRGHCTKVLAYRQGFRPRGLGASASHFNAVSNSCLGSSPAGKKEGHGQVRAIPAAQLSLGWEEAAARA
ncbi:MAG: hypothetical protein M0013_13420 [Actinomycetota bacterium]|nr:hypothetical protein [Actinomycetota bacterium]